VEYVRHHGHLTARVGDRLADVARLQRRQLLAVFLYKCREPAEQPRSVGRLQRTPARDGGTGGLDRSVGLLYAGRL
jgi:hypothetical protein